MFDKESGTGLSKAKGITIDEIKPKIDELCEKLNIDTISTSKIRDAVCKLTECGYVDLGIKRGKKKTYHVTAEGFNYIREIKKNVIVIKKDKEGVLNNNE
jgi:DNA-binding transcriptional regulator GbsR (MarR family)